MILDIRDNCAESPLYYKLILFRYKIFGGVKDSSIGLIHIPETIFYWLAVNWQS